MSAPRTSYNAVPYPGAPPNVADAYRQPGKFPGCFASGLPAARAAVLAATPAVSSQERRWRLW